MKVLFSKGFLSVSTIGSKCTNQNYLDPMRMKIFIGSCLFDPKYSPEDKSAIEFDAGFIS